VASLAHACPAVRLLTLASAATTAATATALVFIGVFLASVSPLGRS